LIGIGEKRIAHEGARRKNTKNSDVIFRDTSCPIVGGYILLFGK